MSDGEFLLTDLRSAKILDKVVEEVLQYICSLKATEKHVFAKIFEENLHTSVQILQICMDRQDSEQRSLQNPAEKSGRYSQIRKDRKPGSCSSFIRDL